MFQILKTQIRCNSSQASNIGDLVYVQQGSSSQMGVIIDRQNSKFTTLKNDGHIVLHNSNAIQFSSSNWAFRPKISQPILAPKLLPETMKMLERHGIPAHVSGHLTALQTASEMKKKDFSVRLLSVHRDLVKRKVDQISLLDFCKHITGFDDSTPAEEFATMSVIRDGLYLKILLPLQDLKNPIYTVRSNDSVKLLKDIQAQMRDSKVSNNEFHLFVEKAKHIVEEFRNSNEKKVVFNIFERNFIEILKDSLKTRNKWAVELNIASLFLRRVGLYSSIPSSYDTKLFLYEVGVFAATDDFALHQFSPVESFEELEGLSEVGDSVTKEAAIHAEYLVSQGPFEYTIENASFKKQVGSLLPEFSPLPQLKKKIEEYKSKLISKPIYSAVYPKKDPLENLRVSHNEPVFAIDSAFAHEIDDGISLEQTPNGDWIHVHIADPTAYIPAESTLSHLAELRGNSIYLPSKHFPLMPDFLSNEIFNLGVSPCAMTFSAKFNNNGKITDYRVQASILKNVRKTTYKIVDTVLKWDHVLSGAPFWAEKQLEKRFLPRDDSLSVEDSRKLLRLQEIALKHQKQRLNNRALIPDQYNLSIRLETEANEISPRKPEISFNGKSFTQNSTIIVDKNEIPQRSPSHILVSESMIIAGRIAAKFFEDNRVPMSYRCQLSISDHMKKNHPDQQAFAVTALNDVLAKRNEINGISAWEDFERILGYMPPAYVADTPQAHSNMGIIGGDFGGYVKVTSPLRRYQDMVGHYQLQQSLLGLPMKFSREEVTGIANRMSSLHKKEKYLARASEKYWTLEYLRRKSFEPSDDPRAVLGIKKSIFEYSDNPNQIPMKGIQIYKRGRFGDNHSYVIIPELGGLKGRYIPKENGRLDEGVIEVVVDTVDPLANYCSFRQI